MQVQARDLTAGDGVELNDWSLHVIAVECEQAVAVMTTELGFAIHFTSDDVVEVRDRLAAA
jgi:hypothetical protein